MKVFHFPCGCRYAYAGKNTHGGVRTSRPHAKGDVLSWCICSLHGSLQAKRIQDPLTLFALVALWYSEGGY